MPLQDIKPWWVAVIAVALGLMEITTALWFPHFHIHYVEGELGIVENLQALLLLMGLIITIATLAMPRVHADKWLCTWLVIAFMGFIYVLGEEISWGQHYFQWATEGWFELHNDQGETNLHNTSSWFDQKPRLLLVLGIILGGIIHPLVKKLRGRGLFDKPWWLAPTAATLPVAILVLLVQQVKGIDNAGILPFELQIFRVSELHEVYIYSFLLVYVASLYLRLRWQNRVEKALRETSR